MEYVNKDITTTAIGIVAHGVNCQGVMGSGVAKAIKDKWPAVYDVYKDLPTGKTMLGICNLITIQEQQLYVANCYTQVFYGYGGRFASTDAIRKSIGKTMEWANYFNLPVFLPKIGAGLGGLDWDKEVEPIILELDSKWERVDTYVCVIE